MGFTWIEALWSVLRRLTTKIDHYFVSADEEQAKQFIKDCVFWCDQVNALAKLTESTDLIDAGKAQIAKLVFPNGSTIHALSSNPKAIRGKRGDVSLDEFAFHDAAQDMYFAAEACARWGDGKQPGHLHVLSTHNGPATQYYRLVDAARRGDNDFALHRVTLLDAVAEGLADRVPGSHKDNYLPGDTRNKIFVQNQRRRCLNEEHFKQEHLCEPMSAAALLSSYRYDLCKQKADVPNFFDASRPYNELFIGVDVARSVNLTVIWVLEYGYLSKDKFPDLLDEHRDIYRTVAVIPIDNLPVAAPERPGGTKEPNQYDILRPILAHPCASKCCIDMGAIGRALSDLALMEFGPGLVEPVAMGSPMKAECAERLKGFVEHQRLGLPRDSASKDDLCSVKRMVSEKGVVSYEGSVGASHCDRFWAASLALHAAVNRVWLTMGSPRRVGQLQGAA